MAILHYKDWALYPNAIPHLSTPNQSFLRMAELYKSMGIKNYFFHLALLNPTLEHVDPHATNLTKEQMQMIGIECRMNPWYYFREVARVPPQASSTAKQLRANRGNLMLYWCYFNHIDIFLIQPRQTGKSLSVDELMIYLMDIAAVNTLISMLTKAGDLRKENIERLKKIRHYLPKYLNLLGPEDADNQIELTNKALNNRYRTAIGQNNKISANNLGRGLTSPTIDIDEGPFINFIDVVIPAMLKAGSAVRDEAAEAGAHYGNIFTTTAGKKSTRSGKFMFELLMGGMPCDERILFDTVDGKEALNVVRANSHGIKPLVNATFSHKQLGYTDEWLKEKLQTAASRGEDADRDYFNRWTAGGTYSPLTADQNEIIKNSEMDPTYAEISKEGYILNWYIPKEYINERMECSKYILGIDTSEAIGRDSITMVMMDTETLEVVAAGSFNETSVLKFSGFVADLLIRFKNIICIPERKSTGIALIETLLVRLPASKVDPFRRVYNLIVDNHEVMRDEYVAILKDMSSRTNSFYEINKRHFGYNTSGSGQHSRDQLYSIVLQSAASKAADRVHDRRLSGEITGLEVKNGRIDHSASGHDDMVIAWLLCVWFLMFSKNLKFYGIERALSKVEIAGRSDMDGYDEYLYNEQEAIKQEIEAMVEELKKTRDDIQAMMIENKIKTLDAKLDAQHHNDSSIDALIREARNSRQKLFKRSNNSVDGRSIIDSVSYGSNRRYSNMRNDRNRW